MKKAFAALFAVMIVAAVVAAASTPYVKALSQTNIKMANLLLLILLLLFLLSALQNCTFNTR